ncbi:uncharacterized protein FPOAC1_013143 [Fusarium poae]|uniref:uncharacterized protein n=1 Tax=Fusarium poae TaxID=36050 RepID=UPI001D040E45|nr:uncharacterized protein FPOAC1_013891 [Fusarium poae]XP_044701227.1 uncharacterized protein FPOAC1_013504 [Fusarium poae]XP_044701668.1 uncharacterized protein FPOAC1_013143 [Fusarium poae]KAG8664184.1 hypothetical protein FPOAC1_013891 [Fusarium poae]KAG8664724.1 hypothetical protein FPOAC1_013504 [Fusarium poae]KAG8665165.1 hypothetical protein FPOAC1_013143 [Fusarium poae]
MEYDIPSLDCDIPEHDAKEKPIGEKPAEDTPERLDWELLVPADAPAEASAYDPEEEAPVEAAPAEEAPTEEAPAAYDGSPEEELPTAEACPVEVYNEDAPAEAKPTEVEETCEDDYVPKEQDATYLPFSSQHKLITFLQEVLEGACFAYGRRELSKLLNERGWNCVEAVPLRIWMDQLANRRHILDTIPSERLLESVAGTQDIAVNRTPIDSSRMKKFLEDAAELTDILKMKDYGDIIRKVRVDINKTTEGLSREEQEAKDRQEKNLKRIAEERKILDEREADVRKERGKNKRERQISAGLEVKGLLDEAKKSFGITVFFDELA